jgi:hypothetical protein
MANLKRIVSILFHLLEPFFTGVVSLRLPREKEAKQAQARLVA